MDAAQCLPVEHQVLGAQVQHLGRPRLELGFEGAHLQPLEDIVQRGDPGHPRSCEPQRPAHRLGLELAPLRDRVQAARPAQHGRRRQRQQRGQAIAPPVA
jgi:hypothetical protein